MGGKWYTIGKGKMSCKEFLSLLLGNTETDDLLRFDFDGDGVLTIFDCVLLLQKATS